MTGHEIVQSATRGIGVFPAGPGLAYGYSVANIRASGVDWDLRRDGGVGLVHEQLDWEVWTHPDGDSFARYWVRLEEVREALPILPGPHALQHRQRPVPQLPPDAPGVPAPGPGPIFPQPGLPEGVLTYSKGNASSCPAEEFPQHAPAGSPSSPWGYSIFQTPGIGILKMDSPGRGACTGPPKLELSELGF